MTLKQGAALIAAGLVSACGGGGGGGQDLQPVHTTLQGPNEMQAYEASSAVADVDSSGVYIKATTPVGLSNTITITTDASGIITDLTINVNTGGIVFSDGGQPFEVPGQSTFHELTSLLQEIYSGEVGSLGYFFEAMSYAVYGGWAYMHTGGHRRAGTLAAGVETPTATMPTGTATYNGSALGVVLSNSSSLAFTGDAQVKVDFGTKAVDTTFSNLVTHDVNTNATGTLPPLSGTGIITGGRYSTDLNGVGFSGGAVYGSIYGPNGEETAGIFQVSNSTTVISGSYGAKK